MDNFTFQNPTKIIFGKGGIAQIGKELKSVCRTKVLIIAGKGSIKSNGVYDQVTQSLKNYGIEWHEYWGIRANPLLSNVREAIEIAKEKKVDAILAVGGGSVIDSAKAVAAGYYMDDVWQAFEEHKPVVKALPLYTVLTISATGSEMNSGAVITHDEDKKKWPFGGPALYPVTSIIDPQVQMSLPWNQTVNGAIDALSHIMEFYFLGTDEEVIIAQNEALMNTVIKVTDLLQKDEKDYAARASLSWAATVALNGLSGIALKGGDWATHMLEHSLSALHPKIAHGSGLAVMFPAWIKYTAAENPAQYERWAKNVWNAKSVDEALDKMKAKCRQWGAPTTLAELNLSEADIPALVENASMLGKLGKVKQLGPEDFAAIYKLAL